MEATTNFIYIEGFRNIFKKIFLILKIIFIRHCCHVGI